MTTDPLDVMRVISPDGHWSLRIGAPIAPNEVPAIRSGTRSTCNCSWNVISARRQGGTAQVDCHASLKLLQSSSIHHRISDVQTGSEIGIRQNACMVQGGTHVNFAVLLDGRVTCDNHACMDPGVGADVAGSLNPGRSIDTRGRVDPDLFVSLMSGGLDSTTPFQSIFHQLPVRNGR